MNTGSITETDPWEEHLLLVYPPDVVADVSQRIGVLIAEYKTKLNTVAGPPLSERDVLLITYGDTLSDGDTPPLQVLHRLYREYLSDIFDLVHILPFHPFSSDDGFSVIDYYTIRQDLGDWSDIEALSNECRIMVDAVINHISSKSEWFQGFLDGRSEYSDYFVECDPAEDLSAVVRPRTSPLLTRFLDDEGKDRYVWTTFSADQIDLNYRNPKLLLAVLDVLFFFVERGARLLRLDAITYLWKQPGTSSANLPETHAIIKVVRSAITALCPDVVIVTETNVPHSENIAYFGDGHDEAHMVYNFALPPLIAHSFLQGNGRRLSDWARNLELPSNDVCFLNFTASHDGVGVRPVEGILDDEELKKLVSAARSSNGLVSSRAVTGGSERPYELNCTFLDLISGNDGTEERVVRRFIASQAIVLAMPGVPAIYIQSLLGMRNDLERVNQTGRARSINRSRYDYAEIAATLADSDSLSTKIFDGLTNLVKLRRGEPAFNPYREFRILELGDEVFAIRRGAAGVDGGSLVCLVNLTDQDVSVNLEDDMSGVDLLTGNEIDPGRSVLLPYAVRWIRHGIATR